MSIHRSYTTPYPPDAPTTAMRQESTVSSSFMEPVSVGSVPVVPFAISIRNMIPSSLSTKIVKKKNKVPCEKNQYDENHNSIHNQNDKEEENDVDEDNDHHMELLHQLMEEVEDDEMGRENPILSQDDGFSECHSTRRNQEYDGPFLLDSFIMEEQYKDQLQNRDPTFDPGGTKSRYSHMDPVPCLPVIVMEIIVPTPFLLSILNRPSLSCRCSSSSSSFDSSSHCCCCGSLIQHSISTSIATESIDHIKWNNYAKDPYIVILSYHYQNQLSSCHFTWNHVDEHLYDALSTILYLRATCPSCHSQREREFKQQQQQYQKEYPQENQREHGDPHLTHNPYFYYHTSEEDIHILWDELYPHCNIRVRRVTPTNTHQKKTNQNEKVIPSTWNVAIEKSSQTSWNNIHAPRQRWKQQSKSRIRTLYHDWLHNDREEREENVMFCENVELNCIPLYPNYLYHLQEKTAAMTAITTVNKTTLPTTAIFSSTTSSSEPITSKQDRMDPRKSEIDVHRWKRDEDKLYSQEYDSFSSPTFHFPDWMPSNAIFIHYSDGLTRVVPSLYYLLLEKNTSYEAIQTQPTLPSSLPSSVFVQPWDAVPSLMAEERNLGHLSNYDSDNTFSATTDTTDSQSSIMKSTLPNTIMTDSLLSPYYVNQTSPVILNSDTIPSVYVQSRNGRDHEEDLLNSSRMAELYTESDGLRTDTRKEQTLDRWGNGKDDYQRYSQYKRSNEEGDDSRIDTNYHECYTQIWGIKMQQRRKDENETYSQRNETLLELEVELLQSMLSVEKRLLANDEEILLTASASLKNAVEVARRLESETQDFKVGLTQLLSDHSKINFLLKTRKLKLLQDLREIYPIKCVPDNVYTIGGVHLPSDLHSLTSSDEMISTALGYVCHVVFMCSKYLCVPLRYRLICNSTRSAIHDSCGIFPLFKDKAIDREQLDRGVYLLHCNMDLICKMAGISKIPEGHNLVAKLDQFMREYVTLSAEE